MSPNFTSDWMTPKIAAWNQHVVPRMHHVPDCNWLEVGSYEGRSSLWILDNVLPVDGRLTCIDFFNDEESYINLWGNPGYGKRFFENTRDRKNLTALSCSSTQGLTKLTEAGERFHGCYLDADHKEKAVYSDLELIWPLLLPGGILVCDDYGFKQAPGTKIAIDKFLSRHDIENRVLFVDFQIIILKEE